MGEVNGLFPGQVTGRVDSGASAGLYIAYTYRELLGQRIDTGTALGAVGLGESPVGMEQCMNLVHGGPSLSMESLLNQEYSARRQQAAMSINAIVHQPPPRTHPYRGFTVPDRSWAWRAVAFQIRLCLRTAMFVIRHRVTVGFIGAVGVALWWAAR